MRIAIIGLLAALIFTSCSNTKKADEKEFLDSLDTKKESAPIDVEVINSILQQIPSPLEISVLLKQSGTKYTSSILNTPDNASKYNNNYKKALNLGIYGTDLGYTNIYQQNQDGIKYLESIKKLANELNIGQFFDIETIGKLATNSKNLDSLLLITTQNFNSINGYFQTQGRSNLSVLLLTGGWLEAMQITCQVAAKDPKSKELKEKIGEQKIILEQIVLLFSFYKEDQNMASLLNDLNSLKAAFDKINITYVHREPTSKVENGVLVIVDNSTTTIDVTDEDIKNITGITNSIRNKIAS